MKLNARQKAFCEYYVACGNATEAAKKAGYSENYARDRIHVLMKNVGICRYIEELQKKAQSSRIMSAVERKEWLTKVLNDVEAKLNDKLKALDILNKMDGEYISKVEIEDKTNKDPFDGLSTEELRELLNDELQRSKT